jgi:hypothetical protein
MLLFIVIHYVVYMFFHLLEKTIHQTFPFTILCESTAKKKKKNFNKTQYSHLQRQSAQLSHFHSSLRVGLEEDYIFNYGGISQSER